MWVILFVSYFQRKIKCGEGQNFNAAALFLELSIPTYHDTRSSMHRRRHCSPPHSGDHFITACRTASIAPLNYTIVFYQ
jgi:hypothetical protein